MKWVYIVTWCVFNVVHIPCPQPAPKYNEFGLLENTSTLLGQPAISCIEKITNCEHRKEFTDRDSAMTFYNRANRLNNPYSFQGLENIKLDSIEVNKH